ncbi:hypothetical protein BJ165DRAFT_1481779 [Panaeolus papilionaceus]|nr:hypothetical protein BJ165DRAFT_1481779 [Panaeolus papilionaceus]
MFKLSAVVVATVFASLTYASPALETRAGPPDQVNICRPSGIDSSLKYFIQSTVGSKVWQAQSVTPTTFGSVDLQTKVATSNDQQWSIFPINHGDSFSFVPAGVTSGGVCVKGDGGPVWSEACPDVATRQAPQFSQFFIFCKTCGANGRGGTGCQIQSAGEGQCASYLDQVSTTVKLDDCSSKQRKQFWDIIPVA